MKRKITIIILILILIIISIFAYKKYIENISLRTIFNQEKEAMQKQVDGIIADYDKVVVENTKLKEELEGNKNQMLSLRDSIANMDDNSYNLFIKFRKRLNFLEEQNKELTEKVKKLNTENTSLKQKKAIALKSLAVYKKRSSELSKNNTSLVKTNEKLKYQLDEAKRIVVENLKIFSMKQKRSGKYVTTSRHKKASALKLTMQLKENNLADSGERRIYVQIINENHKTVNTKGIIGLLNGKKVPYSGELKIEYDNRGFDLTSFIVFPKGSLKKGNYFINIYLEGRLVKKKILTLS